METQDITTLTGAIFSEEIRENTARLLKQKEDWINKYPCSLTQLHHKNESCMGDHIRNVFALAINLAAGYQLPKDDADVLLSAVLLHDIGYEPITMEGEVKDTHWKYYPQTNWSRRRDYQAHPLIAAEIIGEVPFFKHKEIQAAVKSHMGVWSHGVCPTPNSTIEHLCHTCDYLASRNSVSIVVKEPDINKYKETMA